MKINIYIRYILLLTSGQELFSPFFVKERNANLLSSNRVTYILPYLGSPHWHYYQSSFCCVLTHCHLQSSICSSFTVSLRLQHLHLLCSASIFAWTASPSHLICQADQITIQQRKQGKILVTYNSKGLFSHLGIHCGLVGGSTPVSSFQTLKLMEQPNLEHDSHQGEGLGLSGNHFYLQMTAQVLTFLVICMIFPTIKDPGNRIMLCAQ